jgi:hypothetical protein
MGMGKVDNPSNLDRSVTEGALVAVQNVTASYWCVIEPPALLRSFQWVFVPGSMYLLFDTPQTVVGRSKRERPSSGIGKGSDACAPIVQPADALSWLYQRANKMRWNGLFNETGLNDLGYNLTAIVDL